MLGILVLVFSIIFIVFCLGAFSVLFRISKSNDEIYDNTHARGTVRGVLGLFETNKSFSKSCKRVSSKKFKF